MNTSLCKQMWCIYRCHKWAPDCSINFMIGVTNFTIGVKFFMGRGRKRLWHPRSGWPSGAVASRRQQQHAFLATDAQTNKRTEGKCHCVNNNINIKSNCMIDSRDDMPRPRAVSWYRYVYSSGFELYFLLTGCICDRQTNTGRQLNS